MNTFKHTCTLKMTRLLHTSIILSLPANSPVHLNVQLASQSQEECVTALFTVHWVIFIIEVQDVFLGLEAELLIQQHGRVAGGNVKGDVLPHASLHRDETSLSGVMEEIMDMLHKNSKHLDTVIML